MMTEEDFESAFGCESKQFKDRQTRIVLHVKYQERKIAELQSELKLLHMAISANFVNKNLSGNEEW